MPVVLKCGIIKARQKDLTMIQQKKKTVYLLSEMKVQLQLFYFLFNNGIALNV